MTYSEVVQALKDGEAVYWSKPSYKALIDRDGDLVIRHTTGGGELIRPYEGDNSAFYNADGATNLTIYKEHYLYYDYLLGTWSADAVGTYDTIEEVKYEIDCLNK